MSEQLGKLVTCNRCDPTIFLKRTGTARSSIYAGQLDRPVYEELPKTWMYNTGFGHLCPSCAKMLANYLRDFFGYNKYQDIAPCFKVEEE